MYPILRLKYDIFVEAQEKLKKYREDNERKSKEVLDLWESSVKHKIKQLGNDRKF